MAHMTTPEWSYIPFAAALAASERGDCRIQRAE